MFQYNTRDNRQSYYTLSYTIILNVLILMSNIFLEQQLCGDALLSLLLTSTQSNSIYHCYYYHYYYYYCHYYYYHYLLLLYLQTHTYVHIITFSKIKLTCKGLSKFKVGWTQRLKLLLPSGIDLYREWISSLVQSVPGSQATFDCVWLNQMWNHGI